MYLLSFFILHMVVYTSLLYVTRRSVTCTEGLGTLYTTMCNEHWLDMRTYSYFNMNPVQVLRSWLLPEVDDEGERMPYAIGKEYFSVPAVWEPKEHAGGSSDVLPWRGRSAGAAAEKAEKEQSTDI